MAMMRRGSFLEAAGLTTPPSGSEGFAVLVAVVCTRDAVRFATAATSRRELVERVADYVRTHAPEQLWPAQASEVARLLDDNLLEPAIESYFSLVGERWDDEWLVTTTCAPTTRTDLSTNAA